MLLPIEMQYACTTLLKSKAEFERWLPILKHQLIYNLITFKLMVLI
jgi:hypothetical protein